jgi:cytochrome P450
MTGILWGIMGTGGSRSGFPLGSRLSIDILEDDPHPQLALLRESEPVTWITKFQGWLVTDRELAIEAMKDDETYTVDDPRFSTAQVIGPSMLSLDGTDHHRHRAPFVDPFRTKQVRESLEADIIDRARTLVREFGPDGQADLRSQLAAPLAVGVMSDALGLEGVDPAALLAWYDEIVAAVDAVTAGEPLPASGVEAFQELKESVVSTTASIDDSLPALVSRHGDLTMDEIVSNIAVLLFGGIVTTEGTTSTLLYQLLLNSGQLEAVRNDRALVANAVEEAFRIEPAASVVDRYATRVAQLGPVWVNKGDLVRISLSAPNRDPAVFPEPDSFDVRRANANQHLAFARGPHACLGLHLARLETAIALEVLLDELPDMDLDPAATSPPRGLIFRAPQAVGARW